jgi:hypothetical protein
MAFADAILFPMNGSKRPRHRDMQMFAFWTGLISATMSIIQVIIVFSRQG